MVRYARSGAISLAMILAVLGASWSATAPAWGITDSLLTPDPTARSVIAVGGSVSWLREDEQGAYRRVLSVDGVAGDLPVPAGDATFGPGPDGHPTLVYSRTAGNRTTLELFDTVTGTETRAAAPQAVGGACDVIGAVSGDLLVYALIGPPKRCKVLLRVTSADGRVLLTRRGFNVSSIALDQHNIAVRSGEFSIRLRLISLATGRGALVAREDASAYGGAGTITRPSFLGGRLYFAVTSINPSGTYGSTRGPFRVTPGRAPSCASSRRFFGDNVLLESFAVDGQKTYYGDGDHLYKTATPAFGKPKKGTC